MFHIYQDNSELLNWISGAALAVKIAQELDSKNSSCNCRQLQPA